MVDTQKLDTAVASMRGAFASVIAARKCLDDENYPVLARQVASTRLMRQALEQVKAANNIMEVEIGNGDAYIALATGSDIS